MRERALIGVVKGGKVELPEGHGLREGERVRVLPLGEPGRPSPTEAVERFINSPAPPENFLRWLAESPDLDVEAQP